jgi:hypothetical protein
MHPHIIHFHEYRGIIDHLGARRTAGRGPVIICGTCACGHLNFGSGDGSGAALRVLHCGTLSSVADIELILGRRAKNPF